MTPPALDSIVLGMSDNTKMDLLNTQFYKIVESVAKEQRKNPDKKSISLTKEVVDFLHGLNIPVDTMALPVLEQVGQLAIDVSVLSAAVAATAAMMKPEALAALNPSKLFMPEHAELVEILLESPPPTVPTYVYKAAIDSPLFRAAADALSNEANALVVKAIPCVGNKDLPN